MDDIQCTEKYTTSCKHVFHIQCLRTWFQKSDECPICRREQTDDPWITFKHAIHDSVASTYMDAIRSLEEDVTRYRRRIRALRDE